MFSHAYPFQHYTHQVQYRDLHHTLIEIGCPVLDHFDSHNFLRLEVLTLDNLTERSLSEYIENEVTVSASCQQRQTIMLATYL